MHQAHWGPIISDAVGLIPKPATRTEGACASSALAFREGVLAIASGLYDLVLVGGVEVMSQRTTEEVAEGLALATVALRRAGGLYLPRRFRGHRLGLFLTNTGPSRQHLMDVTIKSHLNGKLNPKAQYQATAGGDDGGQAPQKAHGQGEFRYA